MRRAQFARRLKLFDLKRRKIFLTRAGEGLFQYVSEIYRQMVGAEKYLEGLRETSLRVGISATFSSTVARAASVFEDLFPQVKLIVKNATSFEVAEDVSGLNVDVGIVVSLDYKNPRLKAVALSERERLVLVASPANPIFQRKRAGLADICGYPLISGPETSATRRIILNRLKVGGCLMPTPIIVEVNSQEWGMSLIEHGKGMGLYHVKSVERGIADGRLRELPLPGEMVVGADALLRTDAPPHPMADQFIGLVREQFQNHQN